MSNLDALMSLSARLNPMRDHGDSATLPSPSVRGPRHVASLSNPKNAFNPTANDFHYGLLMQDMNRGVVVRLVYMRFLRSFRDAYRNASLVEAVQAGDQRRVDSLLKKGADANARDSEGRPAILLAVIYRGVEGQNIPIVYRLIQAGADVNAADKHGQTTLLLALGITTARGRVKMDLVESLLSAGADIHAKTTSGETPLKKADGLRPHIWHLAARGAPKEDKARAIAWACYSGQLEAVNEALDRGMEPSTPIDGYTPVHSAVFGDQPKVLDALLTRGARPTVLERPVFRWMVEENKRNLLCILLRHGADPLVLLKRVPLLLTVIENDWMDGLEFALARGADPNRILERRLQQTPLIAAAAMGKAEAVRILLRHGADATLRDAVGKTALEYAALGGPRGAEVVTALVLGRAQIEMSEKVFWQCPECSGILMKEPETLAAAGQVAGLLGTATCSYCGHSQAQAVVYAGIFDFWETDAYIRRMGEHRESLRYDIGIRRYRYEGKVVELARDVRERDQKTGKRSARTT